MPSEADLTAAAGAAAPAVGTVPAASTGVTAAVGTSEKSPAEGGPDSQHQQPRRRGAAQGSSELATTVIVSGTGGGSTFSPTRAVVVLALVASGALYFRRPLGVCAQRIRAASAGVRGRLEAPAEELQELKPGRESDEIASPPRRSHVTPMAQHSVVRDGATPAMAVPTAPETADQSGWDDTCARHQKPCSHAASGNTRLPLIAHSQVE